MPHIGKRYISSPLTHTTMKIRAANATYFTKLQKVTGVSDYVATCLNNANYVDGQLESASAQIDLVQEAFARLVECLAEKNHLTAADVTRIAQGYPDEDAKLIRE